ncbi:MAG: phage portal protein [Alloprevotella sp.]|nr:phage portal protein [Alloprevotella sp.]
MDSYTFQDFEKAADKRHFITSAIGAHEASQLYKTAVLADVYDHQRNVTIENYVQTVFTLTGNPVEDFTASNNKIASNFFNRLNTQRVMYSLGNGVSFVQPDEAGVDETKEKMGENFDHRIKEAAYYACIHGESYVFWNLDRVHVFKVTEFVPLWDEHDGTLRGGIRHWRLASNKPMTAVLYEEDGYTTYRTPDGGGSELVEVEEKRAYKTQYSYVPADGTAEVIGEENYGRLPIVPMWASRLKQSTLIGMRSSIDSYDLIRSGFANDLTDCSQIYWIVANAGGMSDQDLARFRDRLKITHIANVDTDSGAGAVPYTQEIPYQARDAYLTLIRNGLYEDFGGLDVHTVAAGATNDHIDAAYQPMDENADDFEFWVGSCIKQLLALQGIEDSPVFKRSKVSNVKEQVETVVMEAQWLDAATVLRKLPNITPQEAQAIIEGSDMEDMSRLMGDEEWTPTTGPTDSSPS